MNARAAEWDVVVVGAGPAGSVTAKLLAERGWRVLVLDRAEFPRTKACGESVNPGGVAQLAELGLLAAVERLPHRRVTGWRVEPVRGPAFRGRFRAGAEGLAVDRAALDGALLAAAGAGGAEVRTGVRVVGAWGGGVGGGAVPFSRRPPGVLTADGTEFRAAILVGADGLRSVVARRLGLVRRPPRLRKVGLTAHVRGAGIAPDTGLLALRPWGCVGVVAVGAGVANVVVILEGAARRSAAGRVEESFDRAVAEVPDLRGTIRCSPVRSSGPFDCPVSRIAVDGALLVGDAAGYFDPFTGQGIYRAIRGARLAAEAIDRALRAGDTSSAGLGDYARQHRRLFGPGEAVQRVVEAVISRPTAMGMAAWTFDRYPRAADALVALTGDVPGSGDLR